MTRPDISFAVNKLSQFVQSHTKEHWAACKRIPRYLKGIAYHGICFRPATVLNLEAFSDSYYAGNLVFGKNGFSSERMTQVYNKNCCINKHVVLFLI